ncbi:hypothetical protein AWU65_18465 [Paenibacillus glucanolyticus]|uniref:Uncharacterized protein n=1 Tax=Paenibacillus glucanolyticus TaxID=59843 RepID=A0A163L2W4_9BACL|nr:hypothetical protein [Paenibacillus glucanolyticus]KZS47764.1 hypothetical protein AWU65_18465 [Paenibacillus glucanolyticus]
MNKQVKLIDQTKLLEGLKKELEFCIKEKFKEKNTRFYLGRESVLTDIIKQIESGRFDSNPQCTDLNIKSDDVGSDDI